MSSYYSGSTSVSFGREDLKVDLNSFFNDLSDALYSLDAMKDPYTEEKLHYPMSHIIADPNEGDFH